ncbi:hypothetical protein HHK36_009242 [Tetracentron sinense]|uniref:Flavin-containing monooxygenase n=1 Tax=Tetracentron sinense TaxID=13715 RepID=A0A835DLG4_TETSI|nr:hypothetical protein HHK36_009242 [Tetracentron sinense]
MEVVVIVGAGPSGLATSACLNLLSIPNIVLEREDCCASLWKNKTYDRLKLHLAKQFCQLPHMPYPSHFPTFISREGFIRYLDDYVSHFRINPKYCRSVESASYDGIVGKWRVTAKNTISNEIEVYITKFLVVATGENSEEFVPKVPGLDSFRGETLHSSNYKNGGSYKEKNVLVVGCGNSGMEIAYDQSNSGARTSIVARNPVHVLPKELVYLGMLLLKVLPFEMVDPTVLMLSKLKYGDLSNYGLRRPQKGPFYLKATTGRSPVIDVGTMEKIDRGEIQVLPSISNINGKDVLFSNGKTYRFDAIIFATGYKSTARNWLKDGDDLLNQDGMPKSSFPNHWKGKDGLYSAGFACKGLYGISADAQNIANDISLALNTKKEINLLY